MFIKQCKALFAPLLILLGIIFLFGTKWTFLGALPGGAFIVDALLGALLGCALGLLPLLYGGGRERFVAQRWFACAILLTVMAYQYSAAFAGVRIPWLAWLDAAHARVPLAEGCLLGCCAVGALRARR